MVSFLDHRTKTQISRQEYKIFCKEYIFYKLKDIRFGSAFCERFRIDDTVIRCLIDEDIAREMIEENYIK